MEQKNVKDFSDAQLKELGFDEYNNINKYKELISISQSNIKAINEELSNRSNIQSNGAKPVEVVKKP